MIPRSGPSTAALLLPLLSLAACGGGGGGVATSEGTAARAAAGAEPGSQSMGAGPEASDLDGLTIRKVGLVGFDVVHAELLFPELLIDPEQVDSANFFGRTGA